jgi:hypothetical protein
MYKNDCGEHQWRFSAMTSKMSVERDHKEVKVAEEHATT